MRITIPLAFCCRETDGMSYEDTDAPPPKWSTFSDGLKNPRRPNMEGKSGSDASRGRKYAPAPKRTLEGNWATDWRPLLSVSTTNGLPAVILIRTDPRTISILCVASFLNG